MVRETFWYGLKEEDVKKLDRAQFMQLIPAKERRSLKRGLTEAEKRFMHAVEHAKKDIKTHCRDMVITPVMLGKLIRVYNGKEFAPVNITLETLGHRLGEFAFTRRSVKHNAPGIGATKGSASLSVK